MDGNSKEAAFKKECKDNYIPRIKEMIKKEKDFLKGLEDTRVSIGTSGYLYALIRASRKALERLEDRLEEYQQYSIR